MKWLALGILFSFSLAFAATEASRGLGFTVSINKDASMSMSILIKNTKENYLSEVKACKTAHALKCLSFHTGSGMTEVPLALVDLVDADELSTDAGKLSKGGSLQKESKESYPWGSVLAFKTDAAHVFYLIPEDRTYSLRLGPISDSLLANHDLQFAKVSWKFKD